MSADNTILIVHIKFNSKKYLVFHVQAAENFEDFDFLLYYIYNNWGDIFITEHKYRAEQRATILDQEYGGTEYGIKNLKLLENYDLLNYL